MDPVSPSFSQPKREDPYICGLEQPSHAFDMVLPLLANLIRRFQSLRLYVGSKCIKVPAVFLPYDVPDWPVQSFVCELTQLPCRVDIPVTGRVKSVLELSRIN